MVYIDQQLKNVFLAHLLDFQLSFARAKLRATNDDIDLLKNKLMILLEDCYLIISLYKKQEDNEKENSNENEETEENESQEDDKIKELNRIREIEKIVASMELIGDSIKDMEEIYDQILEVFKKYLFSQ
jgi:Na+/phosphate symporter